MKTLTCTPASVVQEKRQFHLQNNRVMLNPWKLLMISPLDVTLVI